MNDPHHVVNKGDKPSAETVGLVWIDPAGQRWTQIGYTGVPTVTFESEEAHVGRLTAGIGSFVANRMELDPYYFEDDDAR